jgi:Flp pilus assembly protein TadD
LLCKETAVTILPILFLYDWAVSRQRLGLRRYLLKYLPYLAAIGGYALLRFNALHGAIPVRMHQGMTFLQTLINIVVLFSGYLGKLLVPVNLSAYYVFHAVASMATVGFIVSVVSVAAFALLVGFSFSRSRTAFWAMMMMVVSLLPVFYIQGFGEAVFAERYLYFPSVGYVLAVGSFLSYATVRLHRCKPFLAVLLPLVLVMFAAATFLRNRVWHDEMSLWTDTIQKAPDGFLPQQNLGMVYYQNGDLKNAEKYLSLACLSKSMSVDSLTALAGIYGETERPELSLHLLQRADEKSPQNPQILIMLSHVYKVLGKGELAHIYHKKAESLFPDIDEMLTQRVQSLCQEGERLLSQNKVPEAEVRIREAYSTMPELPAVLIDMGSLLATKGDPAKAMEFFTQAARKAPGNPLPHFNMSVAYEMMGKMAEAKAELAKSKALAAEAAKTPDRRSN